MRNKNNKVIAFIASLLSTVAISSVTANATEWASPQYKYTVRSGDSFGYIADMIGVDVDALMDMNGRTDDTLYVGEVINLPTVMYRDETGANVPYDISYYPVGTYIETIYNPWDSGLDDDKFEWYDVKPGDGYYTIADRLGINRNTILQLNHASEYDVLEFPSRIIIPKHRGNVEITDTDDSDDYEEVETPTEDNETSDNNYTSNGYKWVDVMSGDGWYRIADRYGCFYGEILRLNNATLATPLFYPSKIKVPTTDIYYDDDTTEEDVTETPTVTPNTETDKHFPDYGDGWYSISEKLGIDVNTLLIVNHATLATPIYYGQPIKIPMVGNFETTPNVPSVEEEWESTGSTTYTVRPNDCWFLISDKFNVPVFELLNANNATLGTMLYIGETIVIPTNGSGSVITTPTESKLIATKTLYNYSGWESWHNICQSASMLDGMILEPNEVFSFYDYFPGHCGASEGFIKAPAIFNGETIYEYGGGICFTSTLLHQASCMEAKMYCIERNNHGKPPTYCEWGEDAMVNLTEDRTIASDNCFQNTTGHRVKYVFDYDLSGSYRGVTIDIYAID